MLKEDHIWFIALEEAERLIEGGYIDMPVEELTEKLIEQMKNSGYYKKLLEQD